MTKVIQKNAWVELQVEIHPSIAEIVGNFLIEQGSPGVIQENVSGSSLRKKERIIGYYINDRSFGGKRKIIQAYIFSICKSQRKSFFLRSRIIQEEKWAEAWKSNFKPLPISPRIVVKPPWENYPPKKGQIIIEIDPGMAFGTGTHPSTQMCLQTLDKVIPSFPDQPSLLDVGTGSGILAIAARKLGAKRVVAIDLDPVAVESARKNAAVNKIKNEIDFRVGSLDSVSLGFDIVVANLLPQELLSVASSLAEKISPGGVAIVSGFLQKQKKEVAEAFAGYNLKVQRTKNSQGWACFVLGHKEEEK
ncbi:MAG: 50S ribosomal protein L11 methyltransferase [Deltaproteobacteria bacterium]|nr:50S ribosomal protein L11 methyltransferase [Deltaproteobacteria bacterium]